MTELPQTDETNTIRDMMGLLALPTLWANRDGDTILQIMTEALERIVPLRFSYVHAPLLPDHPPAVRFRVDGHYANAEELQLWRTTIHTWNTRREADARAYDAETPLGPMRIMRFSMGYGPFGGQIWFGASDPSFPSIAHTAYLRAATILATTGLQTARVAHEREEASRAKDEFLAMLGHELRNPLSPIVTALQIMELKSGGVMSHEHTIIKRQVGHLRRLVDDLLDVSRITRGKVELQKEMLNIQTVLTAAIEDVRPLMEERCHTLTAKFADDDLWVSGDITRLTQVFTNLLTNAAKYTDAGGTVALTVSADAQKVAISVRDNGSGISSKLFPRLFNIFEQGSATIERAKGGLGIGLAIVKNLVDLHDGQVSAFSEGVGRGSEFTVTLPLLHHSPARRPGPAAIATVTTRAEQVMLVDDNLDALETLASYLSQQGYEVVTASDPLQALQIARKFRPGVAVLDIGLPVMDGYQLAEELRKEFPPEQLRLLALSGYGQAKDRKRSSASGFETHLVKPVVLSELMSAIASGAGQPEARQTADH